MSDADQYGDGDDRHEFQLTMLGRREVLGEGRDARKKDPSTKSRRAIFDGDLDDDTEQLTLDGGEADD